MHRSITVKCFGSLFHGTFFSYFMQSITEFFFRVYEMVEREAEEGRESSSIIMEFCYLYFFLNPTRKYKTSEKARRNRNENKIRE